MTTVAEGQPSRVSIERIPGSSMLRVSGQVAIGSPAISELAAVPNPTLLYLNALREALARNGIFVGGNPLDIDDARVKPDYSQGDAAARGSIADARRGDRRLPEVEPQRVRGDAAAIAGACRARKPPPKPVSPSSPRR